MYSDFTKGAPMVPFFRNGAYISNGEGAEDGVGLKLAERTPLTPVYICTGCLHL